MGANCDYYFVRDCNDVREAYDRAGGNNDVSYAEGYSGTLAECDVPRVVSGPAGSLDDWLGYHWDRLAKNEAVACYHDGGVLIAFVARS